MKKTNEEIVENLFRELDIFFEDHIHVFIYGAGLWADYIFKVLEKRQYKVDGFITSKKEKTLYNNLRVLNFEDGIDEKIDGIIPGFIGFSTEFILEKGMSCECFNNQYFFPVIYAVYYKELLEKIINPIDSIEEKIVPWNKILVVRLDAIGDLVCTTPIFREIKRNFPKSYITLLCQDSNKTVVEGNQFIDEVVTIEGNRYKAVDTLEDDVVYSVKEARKILDTKICNKEYDRVILPMHILEGRNANLSLAIALLTNSKCIMSWAQIRDERNRLYPYILTGYNVNITMLSEPKHEVDCILEMLIQNGLEVRDNRLDIHCDEPSLDSKLLKRSSSETKYIAVGIVGSEVKKNWPVDKYNVLFSQLRERKYTFVLLGGADAVDAANSIDMSDNVINLVNKLRLKDSMQVISECDSYVGSNTGLMHIATGLGKPCVTLYAAEKNAPKWNGVGPTRWGVRDTPHIDLLLDHCLDDCDGYCTKKYSHCINQISVDEVKQAIKDIMEE